MTLDQFNYSMVQYRSDPSEPEEGAIFLGVVLEFITPDFWVVACAMRDPIESEVLEQMDPLTQELLEKPASLLDGEIRAAIRNVQKPGDVLKNLAAGNPWSIHVQPPQQATFEGAAKLREASIERIAEQRLLKAYEILIHATKRTEVSPEPQGSWFRWLWPAHEKMEPDEAWGTISDLPPVWMAPPRTWQAPILRKG